MLSQKVLVTVCARIPKILIEVFTSKKNLTNQAVQYIENENKEGTSYKNWQSMIGRHSLIKSNVIASQILHESASRIAISIDEGLIHHPGAPRRGGKLRLNHYFSLHPPPGL